MGQEYVGLPEMRGDCGWPRITLVTAVYNGEKYLEETMRSVVQQGYPNLEYIVVDDGSRGIWHAG
jgi:cellulose synthase/poly-beta-1,6-N-acetylglucosamine synthase-like glycosyltransferase